MEFDEETGDLVIDFPKPKTGRIVDTRDEKIAALTERAEKAEQERDEHLRDRHWVHAEWKAAEQRLLGCQERLGKAEALLGKAPYCEIDFRVMASQNYSGPRRGWLVIRANPNGPRSFLTTEGRWVEQEEKATYYPNVLSAVDAYNQARTDPAPRSPEPTPE